MGWERRMADERADPAPREPLASVIRGAWALLTAAHRRRAMFLLVPLAIGVALDAIGVGLVLPVAAILMQGSGSEPPSWISRLPESLAGLGHARLTMVAMGALVAVFLVKSAFRLWLAARLARFASDVQVDLARRHFEALLHRPWAFHLQRNSSTLVQSVVHEVDHVALGVVLSSLTLLADSAVIAALAALLLLVEPLGGCAALIALAGCAIAFHRFAGARAAHLGLERRTVDRARFRQLQQGFGAVKEIKVLGREDEFGRAFARAASRSAAVGEQLLATREWPRITVELVGIVALAVLVCAMLLAGRAPAQIVPVVGLFAVVVLRIVPSVARMLAAVQAVGLGAASVRGMTEELAGEQELPDSAAPPQGASSSAIELRDVTFAYPGAASAVLDGVSLRISRGETVGIVGASGSGKSTLVDLLLGLHRPQRGQMLVHGADAAPRIRWWRSSVGYVPQSIFLTDDTIRRNIALGIADEAVDARRLADAMRAARLDSFVQSLPSGLETVVGERGVRISGGQRQRIGIARALYHDPSVLILDEATSALDEPTESEVMEAIAAMRGSRTIVVVAHRPATLACCDRIVRVDQGRLLDAEKAVRA
jgi:ABC-type multidrug transport system fused ATPase/permease subunit